MTWMIELKEDDEKMRACSECQNNLATDEDLCEECWDGIVHELIRRLHESKKNE